MRTTPLATFRFPSLLLPHSKHTRPLCSLPSPPPLTTPLFLRPPSHTAPLSSILKWHSWAKTLASSFSYSHDNGPDSSHLLRELKWIIDDAFDNPSLIHHHHHHHHHNQHQQVKLRTSLDDLYHLWRRRIEDRLPFQYVVGCEHWRDLVLCVGEGVLIPRPETEMVVDLVEDLVGRGDLGFWRDGIWADLGTGSGAIAIGIARVLGRSGGRVIAVDLSPVAVAVAGFNVERYSLQDLVEVRQGSWFEPLKDVEGNLAGLVSNPPYIPSDDIPGLQAEVSRHEPRLALDGGTDGTDSLLHLCGGAARMLRPGGFFVFETNGEKQSKFLVDYMVNGPVSCFYNVKIVSDFASIPRFVTGFRQ